MTEQQNNEEVSLTVEDANNAAKFFKSNIHELKDKLKVLNKAALERVLISLVGDPLHSVRLHDKREMDAFMLANMLEQAKSVMVMFSIEEKNNENKKEGETVNG